MPLHVYRVLIDAHPAAHLGNATDQAEHAIISVALQAPNAEVAEAEALNLLPAYGWMPLGITVRTSDLTELLTAPHQNSFDSAYGEFAKQWLQIVHEEAQQEGSALHLVSVDYEYLDQPRRLRPPYPP